MKFRKVTTKDIKQVQKLIAAGFEVPQNVANEYYPKKKLLDLFKLELSFVLVDKNKIIAISCAYPDRENKIVAWGDLLVIDPKYQRKGIGTKVMNYQAKLLKSKGFGQLIFYTETVNREAMRFYEKSGYQKAGKVDFMRPFVRVFFKKVLNKAILDKEYKKIKKFL